MEISEDFPSSKRAPTSVSPRAPQTHSLKHQDDATLQQAFLQSKKCKLAPSSSSSQGNLLIRQILRNVTKLMIPKPPRSHPTPSLKKSSTTFKNHLQSRASSSKEKHIPQPVPSDNSEIEGDHEETLFDQTDPDFLSLIHFHKCSLIGAE